MTNNDHHIDIEEEKDRDFYATSLPTEKVLSAEHTPARRIALE